MKRLFLIIVFLLLCSSAWATTYYVDNLVTDTNVASATPDFTTYNPATFETTGGTASVFKTIADINAFSGLAAGSTALFRRGQIWREQLTIPSSGSEGSPITFGAYGSGADPIITGANIMGSWSLESANVYKTALVTEPKIVIINGALGTLKASVVALVAPGDWYWAASVLYVYATSDPGSTVQGGQRDYGIFSNLKDYLTFRNLNIQGSNDMGVSLNRGDHFDVQYCTFNFCGITAALDTWTSTNATLSNNIFDYNNGDAIWTDSTNLMCQNNTISHVYGADSDGIQMAYTSNALVTGNYIDMSGTNSTKNCIINSEGTGTNIISRNTCIGTGSTTLGGGISVNTSNITISYNSIKDVKGADYSFGIAISGEMDLSDITIEYNIITGCKFGIMNFGNYEYDNLKIYNNTISESTMENIGLFNGALAGEIKNNIFWSTVCASRNGDFGDATIIGGKTLVIDYNIWGPEVENFLKDLNNNYYSTLAAWVSGTGYDVHSKKDDPLFVSATDFHLMPRSPAIDAGTSVSLTSDYAGALVPQRTNPSIGAYEYVRKMAGRRIMPGLKSGQVITWASTPGAMTVGDADQTLQADHATASSGLTVSFSTSTTDYCTIVSNKLHAVAAGTCVVHANQAGNASCYAAAQVDSGNITISAAAGGCNPGIGSNVVGATEDYEADLYIACQLFTAACSGTIGDAFAYSRTNAGATLNFCVYSDDGDNAPDASDLKISCIGTPLQDAATTWNTGAMDTAASITSGNKYWICTVPGSTGWTVNGTASGTYYFRSCSGCYASMPANLTGTWTGPGAWTWGTYVILE